MLPADLGPDFYIGIGEEADHYEEVPLGIPNESLESIYWRRMHQDGAHFVVWERVYVCNGIEEAESALMKASTQLLGSVYSDVEEIQVLFGDAAVGFTGVTNDGDAVFSAVMQYGNLLMNLGLESKVLPENIIQHYCQLAENKLTAPKPTPTPMATKELGEWPTSTLADRGGTTVEIMDSWIKPITALGKQLRPGAPLAYDYCLGIQLQLSTQNFIEGWGLEDFTVIQQKTGYQYPCQEQHLFNERVAVTLESETMNHLLGGVLAKKGEKIDIWIYLNVPADFGAWALQYYDDYNWEDDPPLFLVPPQGELGVGE